MADHMVSKFLARERTLTSDFKIMGYAIAAERSFSILGRRRAYTERFVFSKIPAWEAL
jgi:hypothetical protein